MQRIRRHLATVAATEDVAPTPKPAAPKSAKPVAKTKAVPAKKKPGKSARKGR